MKNCLLFLAVVAAMAVAGPAYSQYVYLDVNGDGLNFDREADVGNAVPSDNVSIATTTIDVYFVTDQNGDGSASTCASAEPFTMGSYEAVLRSTGSGTVTFNGWTDNMGFAVPIITAGDGTFAASGTDTWFGRGGNPPGQPPGTYRVGSVSVTVTGTPTVIFGMNSTISGNAQTAFGSQCDGALFDSTIRLGPLSEIGITADFTDSYGSTAPTPVVKSTWGKIKTLYH
jgi:hypothetical protein